MPRILIVDDEPSIVMTVRDEFVFEGFDVETAENGLDALAMAKRTRPDVVVLDLMLPGRNGFEVCRELRAERPELWIIMLTVRGQEADRVTGFEAGADDYVTKPFSLRELVSRVKVGLKRTNGGGRPSTLRIGEVEVDLAGRRVWRIADGSDVALTRTEFDILACLVHRQGEVVTRDEFLDRVWGKEVYVSHRSVDTHMAALRRKIESDADQPVYIQGVRGVGYRLARTSTEP